MKVCVSGHFVKNLALGLSHFVDTKVVYERELNSEYLPQAKILDLLKAEGMIYLTRYSSFAASASELRVLKASGLTVAILHDSFASVHHRMQGAHLLRIWDSLLSMITTNAGSTFLIPDKNAKLPWKKL